VSVAYCAGFAFGTWPTQVPVGGAPAVQAMPPVPETVPLPVAPVMRTVSGTFFGPNIALTVFVPVIDTVQRGPLVVAQPDQLRNADVSFATASRVTISAGVLFGTGPLQPSALPVVQAIGPPVTVPPPVPVVLTVSVKFAGAKDATTVFAAVIDTLQIPFRIEVHPDQDWNFDDASGVATSATAVAVGFVFGMEASHVVCGGAQSIAGDSSDWTEPLPTPERRTVSFHASGWKYAVTVLDIVIETEHVPLAAVALDEVQPDQLENTEPGCGVAVSCTLGAGVPLVTTVEQNQSPSPVPQVIPGPFTIPAEVPVARAFTRSV
jgi:hypothetical protein